jgi:hypothetical protein
MDWTEFAEGDSLTVFQVSFTVWSERRTPYWPVRGSSAFFLRRRQPDYQGSLLQPTVEERSLLEDNVAQVTSNHISATVTYVM